MCVNALRVTAGNVRHLFNNGSDEEVWSPYRVWLDFAESALASGEAALQQIQREQAQ